MTSCSAYVATAAAVRPTLISFPQQPSMSAMTEVDKSYKRAEFWEKGSCTQLEIINVLGRWESATEWAERTRFTVVEAVRKENMAQGATVERYEMAQRLGMVERVAMTQNVPALAFKNKRLAASAGKTVKEMNAMPIRQEAIEICFDALTQSKSSLIPLKVVDERRAKIINAEGGFDEAAFMSGMLKSRVAVVVGFFLLGKGQLYGFIFAGRVLLDATGTFETLKSVFGPFTEPIVWGLTTAAVVYAYQKDAQIKKDTSDYETYSRKEALKKEALLEQDPGRKRTVFDKFGSKKA
eukprot:CAMPEP_0119305654 /NCGR_PEP_ID=MMETSP1333-20130426/6604_1 /TAXON_ID=418940 /ORGANISM="Scyphosphaera apsteinii, Strain RCC1455" /LENGTH=294 /DNA_ID=CAMNT_0007308797 /DNA_START=64 /DNA_END=948 /DNA_ORIENTATION=+